MPTSRIAPGAALVVLGALLCAVSRGARPSAMSAPAAGRDAPLAEGRQLIGAWRLVRIEYSGPHGPMPDPFYQPGSAGMIVYDASGWVSVQIGAPHRPALRAPQARTGSAMRARDVRAKAGAFDTYYAYFGTWRVDARKSAVTHHVVSSLIPAENGLDYTQTVTFRNGRMTFTNTDVVHGVTIVRRKIWRRADAAGR